MFLVSVCSSTTESFKVLTDVESVSTLPERVALLEIKTLLSLPRLSASLDLIQYATPRLVTARIKTPLRAWNAYALRVANIGHSGGLGWVRSGSIVFSLAGSLG